MRVDQMYEQAARQLLDQGFLEDDVPGAKVRPVWEDGSPAKTKYLAQQSFLYEPGQVPLTNYRRTAWKTAIRELLWIYQDKSNDVDYLKEKYNVGYWEEWKNEDGNLGTAYGYQIAKTFTSPETGQEIDQISRVIEQLRENPLNRRIFINLLNVEDMSEMTLLPCAFMTLWTVTGRQLNMTLIQRSGDFLAAAAPGGINSFQYYVLMRMVAQVTGYEPGQFLHFIQNLHIYDRHEAIVEEILQVDLGERPLPRLEINPQVKEWEDFREEDFRLVDYKPDTSKYTIPIAI